MPALPRLGLLLCAFALSCKPSPETGTAPKRSTANATETRLPTAPSSDGETDNADDETVELPLLSREALQARLEAQKSLLADDQLFEDAQGKPVPWISPQVESDAAAPPLGDDDLLSLPGSSGLGGPTEATEGPRVNGNALGLFEPLDNPPSGPALSHFYEALRALEKGDDEDGKVRVLVYGASHTDADVYPHYLRTYLQERFGDGGHGFVHIAKPWRWYGHVDVAVEGFRYWRTEHAQYQKDRDDGYFGLMGASLSTRSKKAFGRVTPREGVVASRYEIYFLRQPRGGSFRLYVDGKQKAVVKTRGKTIEAGYHTFELDEGEHVIEVKAVGNGEIRMFGMTLERETDGVVVDTLGIGGTRAANMLKWDDAVWTSNIQRRKPDLITLFYGTNEATDTHRSVESYEAQLREVMNKLQTAAPEASCLIIGPGDFPRKDGDVWVPRPRVAEIIDVQARVAAEVGCAFWDAKTFMGGELSMVKWVSAVPQMAKSDHIHFTRRGYVRLGMALVDAMMTGFDDAEATPLTATAQR